MLLEHSRVLLLCDKLKSNRRGSWAQRETQAAFSQLWAALEATGRIPCWFPSGHNTLELAPVQNTITWVTRGLIQVKNTPKRKRMSPLIWLIHQPQAQLPCASEKAKRVQDEHLKAQPAQSSTSDKSTFTEQQYSWYFLGQSVNIAHTRL